MRSFVTALALFFAAYVGADVLGPGAGACCSVAACESHDEAADASDECPPGCDDGCACCARLTGAPMSATAVLGALGVHTIVYADEAELAPPAPDPRDRDFVPRYAASAI